MRINPIGINPTQHNRKTKEPDFTGNPKDIIRLLQASKICPCKKIFVQNITNFFSKLEEHPKFKSNFVYNLTGENKIPSVIADIEINGTNLNKIHQKLTQDRFTCKNAACSSTKDGSLAQFIQKIYSQIGVENPAQITLTRNSL